MANPNGTYDHHDQETLHNPVEPEYKPTSIKAQLASWHANRGTKSFARSMIPTYKTPDDKDRVTKNPFKLLGMVSPFAWAMFFSVRAVFVLVPLSSALSQT